MLLGKTIVVTGISSGIGARVGELALRRSAPTSSASTSTSPRGRSTPSSRRTSARPRAWPRSSQTLPQRFDALCNVAGVSGMIGAAKTLAINFYGLRELSEAVAPRLREGGAVVNVASIAGYGWRANLERAKAFVARAGFPDLAPLVAAHQGSRRRGLSAVEGASAAVDDARRASAPVQGARRPGQRRQPRPGADRGRGRSSKLKHLNRRFFARRAPVKEHFEDTRRQLRRDYLRQKCPICSPLAGC